MNQRHPRARGRNTSAIGIEEVRRQCELAREQAKTVKPGRPKSEEKVSNRKMSGGGTNSEYLFRRMARDCPEYLEGYEKGEYPSVRQAAIALEAGRRSPA